METSPLPSKAAEILADAQFLRYFDKEKLSLQIYCNSYMFCYTTQNEKQIKASSYGCINTYTCMYKNVVFKSEDYS